MNAASLQQRIRSGMERARATGKRLGRPRIIDPKAAAMIRPRTTERIVSEIPIFVRIAGTNCTSNVPGLEK